MCVPPGRAVPGRGGGRAGSHMTGGGGAGSAAAGAAPGAAEAAAPPPAAPPIPSVPVSPLPGGAVSRCRVPALRPRHARAAAPHGAVRLGAGGGAGVLRAVLPGLRAAGGHPCPVAGAADAAPSAPALPLAGGPPLGPLLLLRGSAGLRRDLMGLRAAGRPLHLLQHQLLLLDHGRRPLPLHHHREGFAHRHGLALLLPRREVGAMGESPTRGRPRAPCGREPPPRCGVCAALP